ncbi:MAG: hypothetical protein WEA09_15380 [Gemmatimonadota bacterium]
MPTAPETLLLVLGGALGVATALRWIRELSRRLWQDSGLWFPVTGSWLGKTPEPDTGKGEEKGRGMRGW